MRAKDCPELWFFLLVIYSVVVRLGTFNCSARVLDDFNDNLKTAWQDFSFPVGRYANIAEQNGQFKFALARRSADLQCQHEDFRDFYAPGNRTTSERILINDTNSPGGTQGVYLGDCAADRRVHPQSTFSAKQFCALLPKRDGKNVHRPVQSRPELVGKLRSRGGVRQRRSPQRLHPDASEV